MIDTIGIAESNIELAAGYRLLTLGLTRDVAIRPGQFAMLRPHDCLEPLLRRALAVYRAHGSRRLSFLYQVLGRGTEALSRVIEGGEIDVLLPLGNSWPVDQQVTRQAIVVAGGIGSASVFMLCEELQRARIDTQILLGAANAQSAAGCGLDDFRNLSIPLRLTTDDGSLEERGFVTAPLERLLQQGRASDATIYACGPWGMMRRVAELAEEHTVRCLVSVEAPMGCGFGVCVGCVVAVKGEGPSGFGSFTRVCTEGSIFAADEIRWEINSMGH